MTRNLPATTGDDLVVGRSDVSFPRACVFECSACRVAARSSVAFFALAFVFAIAGSAALAFVLPTIIWLSVTAVMMLAALVIGIASSRTCAPLRLVALDRGSATLRGIHSSVVRAMLGDR